ncbi:MAG: hypothetical protein R3C56_41495 [Pirellulaceae bacterium]
MGKPGFAYAHAWLAEYAMMSWKGTDAQAETLLGDLPAAEHGGATPTASQVLKFCIAAQPLQTHPDAMGLLSDYALRYRELNLMLA